MTEQRGTKEKRGGTRSTTAAAMSKMIDARSAAAATGSGSFVGRLHERGAQYTNNMAGKRGRRTARRCAR